MAKEVLYVPEENVKDTIKIIIAGLSFINHYNIPISEDAKTLLKEWCNDEEEYLKRIGLWEERTI